MTQPNHEPQPIFLADEQSITHVNPSWTVEDLLAQQGLFYYQDISTLLKLTRKNPPTKVVRHLQRQKLDPWTSCGLRKVFKTWLVRMALFAPYYRQHLAPGLTTPIDPNWDANTLLAQKGKFRLVQVCRKLPFTSEQLRHQAKRNPNALTEYGIWKEGFVFLVQMEIFGPWIKRIWENYEITAQPPRSGHQHGEKT